PPPPRHPRDDPGAMSHLLAIERRPDGDELRTFPFSVPAVRALDRLDLSARVTFFVGENGSGKSTLLEGIASAAGLPTVGSHDVARDASLAAQRRLGDALRLVWRTRARRGFFLRAEDFFGFTRRVAELRSELQARIDEVDAEYRAQDRSDYARGLALGPLRASLAELESRYGADLDAMSHGQSFLTLFESRFVPGGLYLLDEPEAPLSPHSQLALLAMLGEMVEQDAQFVVATHSPILLAFPDARIYSFDDGPVRAVPYDELPHVRVTRDFLQAPERFLRHLR
ncbi:MAG TPA: AAA family ATPase, partial [Gemmatimonadaceae bacterium]|nr:AAA family ATPase [Gemmatimonadaceae bacterium]